MSYFTTAFEDAIESSDYSQRLLAQATGISQSTISKIKSGTIECDALQLECIVAAFSTDPQIQLNLVVSRCKDLVPEDFQSIFSDITWSPTSVSEDRGNYKVTDSRWDEIVETIRKKGLYNEDLKQSITFLAEVAN
jgi:transcriptional regulator with XRE-family HTH domain